MLLRAQWPLLVRGMATMRSSGLLPYWRLFVRTDCFSGGRSERFAQDFVQEPERSLALGRCVAWKFTPADNAVDHSVLDGLCGVEDVVSVGIALDLFERLTGRAGEDIIEDFARAQDLPRLDVDIGGLAA